MRLMPGLKGCLILALNMVAGAACACNMDYLPEFYQGNYELILRSNESALVSVEQFNEDLRVQVNTSSGTEWINHPGGRNSKDFIFVSGGSGGEQIELCLYSVYKNSAAGTYSIETMVVQDYTAETESTAIELGKLNLAGQYWDSEQNDQSASLELYRAIRQSNAANLFSADWQFYLSLYELANEVKMGRYSNITSSIAALNNQYGSHREYYKIQTLYGEALLRTNQVDSSIEAFIQALAQVDSAEAAYSLNLNQDKAEIKFFLGEALTTQQRLDEAEVVLTQAADDAQSDFQLLANIFNNKGYLSIKRSESPAIELNQKQDYLQQSTDEHLAARYFAQYANDMPNLQIIENNLAVHYARIGERRKSFSHFMNVMQSLDGKEPSRSKAFLYSNLSLYFESLGNLDTAILYLQQGIDISLEVSGRVSPFYYCRLGELYREKQNTVFAIKEHTQCLFDAAEQNDMEQQSEAYLELANDYFSLGNLESTERLLQSTFSYLGDSDNFNLKLRAWMLAARLNLEKERYRDALLAIENALSFLIDDRHPEDEVDVLYTTMLIHEASGNNAQALAVGLTALDKIETLHAQLEAESLGPAWSNRTHAVYLKVAQIYLAAYNSSKARAELENTLLVLERSKSISLRQRLSAPLPEAVDLLEEQGQLDVFSSIANLLANNSDVENIPRMNLVDYQHKHDLLSLSRLSGIDDIPVPPPLSLAQMQSQLGETDLVLYYFVSDVDVSLFVVTNESIELEQKASLKQYLFSIAQAKQAILNRNNDASTELAEVASILLPDLASYYQQGKRDIVVVDHTGLYDFPLAALPVEIVDGPGQALIQFFSLRRTPSLSLFLSNQTLTDLGERADLAIMADPTFNSLSSRQSGLEVNDERYEGWSSTLERLPFSAIEARNLQTLFPQTSISFTNEQANRQALISSEVRNAKVLHLATHGYFNSELEDNIGIALAADVNSNNTNSGFISLTELFSYSFNNELVVISGCETAMGRESAGTGLNSLSRGFMAQGVKHVIATLWPVSDRASAEFMKVFYKHLKQQQNVEKALQLAQADLSQHELYSDPFYWASYMLVTANKSGSIRFDI